MNVKGMEKKSRILCGDEFSGRRQLGKAGADLYPQLSGDERGPPDRSWVGSKGRQCSRTKCPRRLIGKSR